MQVLSRESAGNAIDCAVNCIVGCIQGPLNTFLIARWQGVGLNYGATDELLWPALQVDVSPSVILQCGDATHGVNCVFSLQV